jgi:hypothetical protein
MRLLLPALSIVLACCVCGCANHTVRAAAPAQAPVVVSDGVRESLPNDYMRVSFLSAGTAVTSLSRPGALRAFATATPPYEPPLRVKELPYYSGLVNDDTRVLVAMRCRPAQPAKVDAVLATWPNVFLAIQRDVPLPADGCTSPAADAGIQMACYARGFTDPPATAVPTALAHVFDYAAVIFDGAHASMAKWLKDNYGIFPAFAGSGYSIKDSYSLDGEPMTSQQILVKSVSSEYILKNVSLADAGCRCITVAPYSGRADDPLDANFIAKAGGDGSCVAVKRLGQNPPSQNGH